MPLPARIGACLVIRAHSFTSSPRVCIAWRQPCCPPWPAISNPYATVHRDPARKLLFELQAPWATVS